MRRSVIAPAGDTGVALEIDDLGVKTIVQLQGASDAEIGIVIAGVTIIFSEGGGGVRKLAFVGLGIAIMFAAVSFFLDFFGFAGGAVI